MRLPLVWRVWLAFGLVAIILHVYRAAVSWPDTRGFYRTQCERFTYLWSVAPWRAFPLMLMVAALGTIFGPLRLAQELSHRRQS